ncbi:hypothetical protein V6N13_073967 [Hibiscus sabdariffa]
MIFSHQSVIKAAMKQYVVLNGYNVRLKVNDSRRLQVVCKAGCPWMIWASRLHPKDINETTWQIKTYIGDHSCIRDTKIGNCTARWLAKAYIDKWRVDPTYSTGSLQKDVQHDHILQDGFKAGCRPIISIDGCFLKGHFRGYLLAAVGIDANDCIYPLAYAVVESENTSSWCWNAGGNRYEVPAGHEDQHVVDLGAESCTCRKWDLTAVIIMRGERPEGFVNNCYKTETQLQIYSNLVKPLGGPKQWPRHVTNEPILPPFIRRPVGRPQRNRRKEADEILTSIGRM